MASTMTMKHTISHNVFFSSLLLCQYSVIALLLLFLCWRYGFFHISLYFTLSLPLSLSGCSTLSLSIFFSSFQIALDLNLPITTLMSKLQLQFDEIVHTFLYVHRFFFILFVNFTHFSSFYLWISICLLNLIRMLHNFAEIII